MSILVLPIKKKWFEMIASGEKKEEYREIKPYYDSRIGRVVCGFPFKMCAKSFIEERLGKQIIDVIFRNGYSPLSPEIWCKCIVTIGEGKVEWGAKAGEKYYVLKIVEIDEVHSYGI